MNALGWTSLVRLVRRLGTRAGTTRAGTPKGRKTTLSIDSLEPISLLSAAGAPVRGAAAALLHDSRHHHRLATPAAGGQGSQVVDIANASAPVTLPPQTVSLGDTLTNFTDQPLSPSLNLFDPSLGTLLSVAVNQTSLLQSNITSQNLSPTSTTVITATLSGGYQINGLNQPIVVPTQTLNSQPQPAGTFGSNNDTVTFPPLQISQPSSAVFSDPASLAFFTASPGRPTITATMSASGSGSASAPNGNLLTIVQTSASATVNVSYTYLPTPPLPIPCPTVGKVGRIGLHHQRTLLIVPFSGVVNPTIANNPANYLLIRLDGQKIHIKSANFNPATNTVTLIPAHRLNVHHFFRLKLTLPCTSGPEMRETVNINRKFSLIGFHNHLGEFVPVHFQNRRLVKGPSPRSSFDDRPGPRSQVGETHRAVLGMHRR